MTTSRDPERLIHAFLLEGEEILHDRVYDVVRAEIEQKPQRAVIGPWRMPIMNKIVGFGLAAAAVVAAVLIGAQLLGSPGGRLGGTNDEPTPTLEASAEPTSASSAWTGIPAGPFVVSSTDDPVLTTVSIASPDWSVLSAFDAVGKGDDGLDAPESVGALLLAWAWPVGTAIDVFGDPCQWSTTIPETPATTPDEIAAAFAAQAESDATDPVDVTVGGYRGKAITLSVPMTYDLPDGTRDEKFAECDNGAFIFYRVEGAGSSAGESTGDARGAQGAGQIDELWILDVEGSIVILDAAYSPATPPDLVEELRTLAESATFEVP